LRRYIEANEFPLMGDWYGVTYNKSALSEITYRGLKKRDEKNYHRNVCLLTCLLKRTVWMQTCTSK
jgi:hypothetical protein